MNGKGKLARIIACIAFVVIIALSFVFLRNGKTDRAAGNGSRKILCTTYPVFLFVREVAAGGPVRPELLLPPDAGCPHDYSLTPGDLMKLSGIVRRSGINRVLFAEKHAGKEDE